MKKIFQWVAPLGIALTTITANAQHKCSSHELLQQQLLADPNFAKQLAELDTESMKSAENPSDKKTRALITIPVVYHVIHNGQALGVGPNVTDAKLLAQLAVLNRDFKKRSTDTLKANHPFYKFAANCEIEFCLAQQTPSGAVSTGIERFNYGSTSFDQQTMNGVIKPQTIWDSKKYLNLWVCNLVDAQIQGTLLGYAQFPLGPEMTDGVVLLYSTLPSTGTQLNVGRTAVHEVGHWLNLRHIWGDDSCGNDQVNDTPIAKERNFGCPSFPHNPNNGCDTVPTPNGEMYMNYMDYVDDACMNTFTFGQKDRMWVAATKARAALINNAPICGNGVAINSIELANDDIHIFPNPASHQLNIRFQKGINECEISLVSITGVLVQQKNQMPKNDLVQLDLTDLALGVYFVKINIDGQSFTKKISKQ